MERTLDPGKDGSAFGIRVAPTAYGLGLFAARTFAAEERLGPVAGEVVEGDDYSSEYGIDLGESTLEPAAPFRYLNHSCDPNCALVIFESEDEATADAVPQVWVEVLRAIAVGEQLTIDYAWPADAAIPCQCGVAACRGWIVSADELHAVPSAPR